MRVVAAPPPCYNPPPNARVEKVVELNTVRDGFTFYGISADTAPAAAELLNALLASCSDITQVRASARKKVVIVTAPHRLASSPLLTGMMQMAVADTEADRLVIRAAARQQIIGDYQLPGVLRVWMARVLDRVSQVAAVSLVAGGVQFDLHRFPSPYRNLIRGELYQCLRSEAMPRFWWRHQGIPGADALAGEILESSLPKTRPDFSLISDRLGAQPHLLRVGGGTVFLGVDLVGAPFEAMRLLTQMVEAAGIARSDSASRAIRFHGALDTLDSACMEPGLFALGSAMVDILKSRSAEFLAVEGDDTILSLDALYEFRRALSLEAPVYGELVDWCAPLVLTMIYESLRQPEDPAVTFMEGHFGYSRLRVGWPHAERFSPADLDRRTQRFITLTGKPAIHAF